MSAGHIKFEFKDRNFKADYEIFGHYYKQTNYSPEEYPEIEFDDILYLDRASKWRPFSKIEVRLMRAHRRFYQQLISYMESIGWQEAEKVTLSMEIDRLEARRDSNY